MRKDPIIDFLSLEIEGNNPNKCKGVWWRGRKSTYLSSHKTIEQRVSLRVLKRMSCPGCEECGWIWEFIAEDICCGQNLMSDIKDGGLYQFRLNGSKDWETGHFEVDYSEFVEVKNISD